MIVKIVKAIEQINQKSKSELKKQKSPKLRI